MPQTAPFQKVITTTSQSAKFCGFDVETVQTVLECGHQPKPLTRFKGAKLAIPAKRRCKACARETYAEHVARCTEGCAVCFDFTPEMEF
jgi:hypothetical protein